VVFDLSGDGKTVLKGNYGYFWHNPGVGVGSSANPNTPATTTRPCPQGIPSTPALRCWMNSLRAQPWWTRWSASG